jgi:ribosomal protein S18 acetylase RimI-like enzyme
MGKLYLDRFENLGAASQGDRQHVWEMLKQADKEFIPPLSSRRSPKDIFLKGLKPPSNDGPTDYYTEMYAQSLITAKMDERVMGFISYQRNYTVPELGKLVGAYVSTIVIDPEFRGRKITYQLYNYLFESLARPCVVAARTWSTNRTHIPALNRLGFSCVWRDPDGRGTGIDTVIYEIGLK